MNLSQITHSEFLNKFCENGGNRKPLMTDTEKLFLSQITAAEWISWLEQQDGRKKLSDLVNDTRPEYMEALAKQIGYIKDCILNLSTNDYSRLTDSLWSSIPMDDKKVVQSVLTLPYPFINDDNLQLEFLDINIPVTYDEIQSTIHTAVHILFFLGFNVHKSPQIMRFIESVVTAIKDRIRILYEHEDIILFEVYDNLNMLFFILFHPDHHDKIKDLDVFIKYMTDPSKKSMFFMNEEEEDPLYHYTYIKIFINSSESYLKELSNKTHSEGFIKIHKDDDEEEEEETWWGKICEDILISPFKHVFYEATILNEILVENPIFMDKMLQCTKKIRWGYNESMSLLKTTANKLTDQDIFDGSPKAGLVAKLLYEVIGISCLDALSSDSYVNSLSDDDKELLTLWTHACSLFQNKRKRLQDKQKQENDEIKDLTKIPWLRNRLHHIFMQSPKTKTALLFYRGISVKCSHLKAKTTNPIAVTFDKDVAKGFAGDDQGCFLRIIVPESSNILAIDRVSIYEGDESEILLMSNSTLRKVQSFDNNQENEVFVEFETDTDANSKIVPLPKPSFHHKEMSWEEFGILLLKSNLFRNTNNSLDVLIMLNELYTYDSKEYEFVSDSLFNSIRTWQIIHCGFGDVKLAIGEFWRLYLRLDLFESSSLPLNDQSRHSLQQLKKYCDIAWTSRKSLARQNKIETILDTLQKFVRPFVQENQNMEM